MVDVYNCNWLNRIYLYSQKNRIKEGFAALGLKNRNFDIENFDFLRMKFSLKHSLPHENFDSFSSGHIWQMRNVSYSPLRPRFKLFVVIYLFIVMNRLKELLDEKRFFKSLII